MKKIELLIIGCILITQVYPQRNDTAIQIAVPTASYKGSFQNGSWSPDNKLLMCTNWEGGYNKSPANILIVNMSDYTFKALTTDGESNVNMPGTTWNPIVNRVIFSSESNGDGDQVHTMDPLAAPGTATRVTPFIDRMCWEPGFSPDGKRVVYEAHYFANDKIGIVETYKIDGTENPVQLTSTSSDSRQPSWSPVGDKIVYQVLENSTWDIWTMKTDGTNKQNITGHDAGDKTDASFSPDGKWIVYSTGNGVLEYANIFIKNLANGQLIRVTDYSGYDGAPSWSSNNKIVFESTSGDPDNSSGATLWFIDATVNGTTAINQMNHNNNAARYSKVSYITGNYLNISLNKNSFDHNSILKIYNSFGRLIEMNRVLNIRDRVIKKDISRYSTGLYFLSLSDSKKKISFKVFLIK